MGTTEECEGKESGTRLPGAGSCFSTYQLRAQWYAGECIHTGSPRKTKPWFVVFTDICGVKFFHCGKRCTQWAFTSSCGLRWAASCILSVPQIAESLQPPETGQKGGYWPQRFLEGFMTKTTTRGKALCTVSSTEVGFHRMSFITEILLGRILMSSASILLS